MTWKSFTHSLLTAHGHSGELDMITFCATAKVQKWLAISYVHNFAFTYDDAKCTYNGNKKKPLMDDKIALNTPFDVS